MLMLPPDMMGDFHKFLVRQKRIATCNGVATYYLGLKDFPFHREIYRQVDGPERHDRIIIPAPRDHGKSTAVAITLPLKRTLNNPNYRTLVAQKSKRQAEKTVRILREQFESNPRIVEDFGDLRGNPWESDKFYVKRRATMEKDPTVEGVGVLGAITGGHFDLIVLDDILDEENTKTELKRQRTEEWLRGTIMPMAEPGTQIACICTRKHFRDLYGWLLENPLWFHPACRYADYGHHNACGYRAIETFPLYDFVRDRDGRIIDISIRGDYEVLEPAHRDIEWLLTRRGETGDAYFRREYQNDPSGMEGIFFHDEWLGRWLWPAEWHSSYEESEHMWVQLPPLDQLRIFAAVDPAIGGGGTADYFAQVVIGMDSIGRVFLLETFTDRLTFPEQVRKLEETDRKWDPAEIYVESNVFQDSLQQQVATAGPIPLVPIKTNTDKRVRAVSIQPYLEQRRVYVRENQEDFWVQWKQFPSGRHDDLIDAFMMSIEALMKRPTGSLQWSMYGVGGKPLHESTDF